MPRLVQGARSSAHGQQPRRVERMPTPQYEPPEHPLTDDAQRELSSMSQRLTSRKYEHHLEKSVRLLSDSVGPINEFVQDSRHQLQECEKRRLAKSRETGQEIEKTDRELRLEERLKKMEKEVQEKTVEIEKTVRQIIDYKVELLDDGAAMAAAAEKTQARMEAYNQVKARVAEENARKDSRRHKKEALRQQNGGLDEADEDEEELVEEPHLKTITPIAAYKEAKETQRREYESASAVDKYGQENEYAAFRKLLHDAQHVRQEKTLPPARHWFDQNGEPIHIIPRGGTGENGASQGEDGSDEDEDLVVAREVRDYRCPITMTLLKDPVTSKKCIHSYEKAAFAVYMRQSSKPDTKCPVNGCNQRLRMSDVSEDATLKRTVQHLAKRMAEQEEEDEDDDDDETSRPG